MKIHKIKITMIVLCVLAAGIFCILSRSPDDYKEEVYLAETQAEEASQESLQESNQTAGEEELPSCYIHICGEVVSPGVYELAEGSRIFQVIEKAGGLTANAAADSINMAEKITDGMKLIVLSEEEAAKATKDGNFTGIAQGESSSVNRVNLNTASKEELMTLRGVGEAKADDIIRYRDSHGGFKKIEDIMNISGIKEAAFQKIKDDITV